MHNFCIKYLKAHFLLLSSWMKNRLLDQKKKKNPQEDYAETHWSNYMTGKEVKNC